MEKLFFSWLVPKYEIPTFGFIHNYNPFLIILCSVLYSLHFVLPAIIALYIGYIKPDRETFSTLRNSIIIITVMGFTTFILFPVAPPWYVLNYGLVQPSNFVGTTETAAGLLKFDQLFGINFYGGIYDTTPPAPFAAFPSLHSGWSSLTALVLVESYKASNKKIYLLYLYPLSVWFATIYLQHHYIIDLVGGLIYAIIAYLLATKVVEPLIQRYSEL